MSDSYMTLLKKAEDELVEKRSRFIAHVSPVTSEREATEFISEVKSANYNAKHNVFAYVLRNGTERYSDDSEPQGTAGIPVLEVLRKNSLTDSVITVTRYFGGILLGTGGLTRAYSSAAALGVKASGIAVMKSFFRYTLKCDYSLYKRICDLISQSGGKCLNADFGDSVGVEFLIPAREYPHFYAALTDISRGSISPEKTGEQYACI